MNILSFLPIKQGDIFYNPDGTLKTSSYGSQTANYSYNLANLLTEVNNANSGTQISKYNYTYYVDGNQKSKSESVAGTDKGTTNYTYDGVNRLVTEQAPDKTLNYQYDSYGNRSQLSVTGDEAYTTSYTYDKNNRLRKQTKAAGSSSEITDFWYDPNGNQISSMTITTGGTGTAGIGIQPAGQSMNSYSEYNSWNQLISTMQNGKTASYAYNGDGLRMSKTVDGVKTSHIWDGTNIAGDVTNGTVTKYIRGIQLISSKTGSNESFYTYNGHGDVVQLTGGNGSITKQYSYDAFGVEKDKAEDDTNPFRYCGEYYDTETDSVYLRARYYAPVTGRFTTEDPIMDGLNWYVYCSGDPLKRIDPSGLYDRDAAIRYAVKWYNGTNSPTYERFDGWMKFISSLGSMRGDCANFVSQCLVAGGLTMNNLWHYYPKTVEEWHTNNSVEKRDRDMTPAWASAKAQYWFFSSEWAGYKNGEVIQIWTEQGMEYNIKYNNIQKGDLMFFAHKNTGEVYHSTIISDITNNEIKYAAHTQEREYEPLSKHLDDDFVVIVKIRNEAVRGYTE